MANSDALPVSQSQPCPECGKNMAVVKGFVPWCQSCNWNLGALSKDENLTPFERYYLKIGNYAGEQLLQSVLNSTANKPSSISVFFAYLIAGVIHLVSLLILVCGIWLAVVGWGYFFYMISALLCLIVAWVTRPRLGKMKETVLKRDDFPTLYRIVDEISAKMGAKKVDGITVNFEYNAAYSSYGMARKNYIHLGLPLVSVLKPEQLVALIGHELGHGVNGDSTRGFIVGTAIGTLMEWHYFIKPDYILERNGSLIDLFMVPVNLLLLGLSKVILGILMVLTHLLWRNKQRAEYLADDLAAQVSGLQAKLSLLEKLHLEHIFVFAMQRMLTGSAKGNAADEIRAQFQQIPDSEIERVQRIGQFTDTRLDATHPPTSYRIQYLKNKRSTQTAAYKITEKDQALLDKEWRILEERVAQQMVGYYKDNPHLLY
jgi:Zn-dependent protease with chaperone function